MISQRKKIVSLYLASIKNALPKKCTHLSLMKRYNGDYVVRSVVNKVEYMYSIPQDFAMTEADLNRLKQLIHDKCEENVEEGN